jgi:hypothetical protein
MLKGVEFYFTAYAQNYQGDRERNISGCQEMMLYTPA